jgi:flagellar hook-length control protein FliK
VDEDRDRDAEEEWISIIVAPAITLATPSSPSAEFVLADDRLPASPLDSEVPESNTSATTDQPTDSISEFAAGELPVIATLSDVLLSEIVPEPSAIGSQSAESTAGTGINAASPGVETSAVPPPKLSQELLSAMAGSSATEQQPVSVDTARVIHRVARAFGGIPHGGEVRMKLSPPALGALRLEVLVQDGKLTARLEAETAEARTAILEGLPALRERLAEQGIRIERFDVDLMQRQSSGTPQESADHSPPEDVQAPPPRVRRMPQVAEGVVARTTRPGELDPKRLNVIV